MNRAEVLASFFEMSPTLLCTADDALCLHELNPAWGRVLGWTPGELRARSLTEFLHPEDRAAMVAITAGLTEGSPAAELQCRCLRRDGHWVPLTSYIARRDRLFHVVAIDRSEASRQESLLRESEARLRAVFETAVDAIVTADGRGVIAQVNPAVERLFGFASGELVGRNVSVLMPSPEREQHDEHMARYARSGVRTVIGIGREVRAARKDGSTFPAELALSEHLFRGERYFTAMIRDISDRKRLERMRAELVATVSHELRTPLTSISAALSLLAGGVTGELPPKAKEYVSIAISNGERLARLVNDILDHEKIESGSLELRMTTTSLGLAVQGAMMANHAFVTSHGARLVLASDIPDGEVLADPDRLAQVLTNLIANAARFSPEGAPVEISASVSGLRARVSIRDHGPGIPEEFQGRIFQRFAQADASSSRRKGGTGLGLSISRALVEKMGGRIGFEPAAGGGTVFFFELSCFPPVGSPPDSAGTAPDAAPRVLVCEDDAEVSRALEEMLSASGLTVHLAPTLERARRLLASHSYDAVTLDLQLADGAGDELIGLVGQAQVVVFSGSDVPAEVSRRVATVRVKSRTPPADVRDTVLALLSRHRIREDRA